MRRYNEPTIQTATEEQEARDVAYANTVIGIAADDVKQVYLRVTGVLGLAAIFVTQLPFGRLLALPTWARWIFMAGLAAAVGSAALYFYYLSKIHLSRLKMAQTVRTGHAAEVDKIWAGEGQVWNQYRWAFHAGSGLLALSAGLLGLSLAVLLNLDL